MADACFIGVDVGTGSARAGVFDASGTHAGSAKRDIAHLPRARRHRRAVQRRHLARPSAPPCATPSRQPASRPPTSPGIGFDATCSLVVLGEGGAPLAGRPVRGPGAQHHRLDGPPRRRAGASASTRRRARGAALCRRHHLARDGDAEAALAQGEPPGDLRRGLAVLRPDRLPDLAGDRSLARSVCTVTCKWTYLAHERRWDADYFRAIGLGALADEGFARIGSEIVDPGTPLGQGLTEAAPPTSASLPGTPVAAGLIDAHAGGVGTVGAQRRSGTRSRMAYVFGTSACTMATTREPGLRARRLGSLLLRDGPGPLAQRRRPVGRGRRDRPARRAPSGRAEAAAPAAADGTLAAGLAWPTRRAEAADRPRRSPLAGGLHVVPGIPRQPRALRRSRTPAP